VRGEAFAPVPNRGMITISIMLANIMQGVDNTILNVALPHIQGSLSASLDQIAWALTSYIVCAAIMMPLTGWLARRFGIKHIFLISVIGFTLASALCGAATSLGELVLFRGVAGGGWGRADPAVAGDPAADLPRERFGSFLRSSSLAYAAIQACRGSGRHAVLALLAGIPRRQLALRGLFHPVQFAWRLGACRHLQPDPIRVEEVDRLAEAVVFWTQHIDAHRF
jgi:MFS family permease